jgi:hypothetical protein
MLSILLYELRPYNVGMVKLYCLKLLTINWFAVRSLIARIYVRWCWSTLALWMLWAIISNSKRIKWSYFCLFYCNVFVLLSHKSDLELGIRKIYRHLGFLQLIYSLSGKISSLKVFQWNYKISKDNSAVEFVARLSALSFVYP